MNKNQNNSHLGTRVAVGVLFGLAGIAAFVLGILGFCGVVNVPLWATVTLCVVAALAFGLFAWFLVVSAKFAKKSQVVEETVVADEIALVTDGPTSAEEAAPATIGAMDEEESLDKNVRLLSPTRMVMRRFFRSKLSVVGLVMIIGLFVFSWFGPVVYRAWGEIQRDTNGKSEFVATLIPVYERDENGDYVYDEDGQLIVSYTFYQIAETRQPINTLAPMSWTHLFGTDEDGMDVFTRIMYGGRISLAISFIAVFFVTFLGVIFGGLAGYFGRWVDNLIMRICDILMCIPGLPIMLILGTIFEAWGIDPQYRIYFLMFFLTLISWPGTARLVRGQILSLREQEYMVAAEAMGFSTTRKIFKHLVPNVLPQLIVSMTLGLGGMILQEATLSFLNLGVKPPYAALGTMVNAVTNPTILSEYFNVWGPPGLCIIIAVLGFNFIGDGLRDALDPKARR